MFESVLLGQRLDKEVFKENEAELRHQLLLAQQELRQRKIAVLILVAGMDGAGKGDVIDRLNKWLDSRNMQVHAFWNSTDEERERPTYWSFWRRMPARGSIGIFFGGWYWSPLRQHGFGEMDQSNFEHALRRIADTEKMLQADGMLIIKLWFHLDKKSQKKVLEQRDKKNKDNPILRDDKNINRHYGTYCHAAERMIRFTNTPECPWHMIEAVDKHYRDYTAGQIILDMMQARLHEHRHSERRQHLPEPAPIDNGERTILDQIDLHCDLDKDRYDKKLGHYQDELQGLAWQCFEKKLSVVLVFEGWDAAGKGGTIRRLTDPIDARLFRAISVAAPTDEELAHHYLWRFWRQIPRAGYFTMYDRSWYGRVLVERIEGYADQDEWGRAYLEINDFEEQLVEHGIVLLKFWLHIDKDEQERRFVQREKIPWKQHKLTADDWRNRDKWEQYKFAVHDMIAQTSTDKAPWQIVPANNKYCARLEVIQAVCANIKQKLSKI